MPLQRPIVCLRCFVTACPGVSREILQLRQRYLCEEHEARAPRPGRPFASGGRATVVPIQRIATVRRAAEATLICPICGLIVEWNDAVATTGDHVVHAWCHPYFAAYRNHPDPPRRR